MTNFTLRQLEIFIAVANHLSISNAAHALHLSQPAVSQQIRKIEMYSGVSLFEQIGKKSYLSEDGKHLLEHAKNVIEQAELFKIACVTKNKTISGKLRVGVGVPLQILTFNIISKFLSKFSSVDFEFLDGDRKIQLHYLSENKLDFCLIVHPINNIKLTGEILTELPMTFIISPQHHLAGMRNITPQMLFDETFIICEEGTANYHQLHELFKSLNYPHPKLMQIKDQNAVKHAVMANLGISVLPRYMLQLEFKNHLLVPLSINEYAHPVTAAYWVQHTDKNLTPLIQAFKTFLFNELKEMK